MVNLGEKNWERICGFEIKKSFRCLKKDFQSDICKKNKISTERLFMRKEGTLGIACSRPFFFLVFVNSTYFP